VFGVITAEGETAEGVEEKAMKVFKDAGVELVKEDIAVAHRAGGGGRGPKPILVKFVSR
jgi:H2-forming N5,N10-methylenetetrahydromethanopterin dehydrogenase-like enzyme